MFLFLFQVYLICDYFVFVGVFDECGSEAQQSELTKINVHLLYEQGLFFSFIELLCMEVE